MDNIEEETLWYQNVYSRKDELIGIARIVRDMMIFKGEVNCIENIEDDMILDLYYVPATDDWCAWIISNEDMQESFFLGILEK